MPKTVMALLYSYLVSKNQITLPSVDNEMLTDDSEEIEETFQLIINVLAKEKEMIKSVKNFCIESLVEKRKKLARNEEEKKYHEINQKIKIKAQVKKLKNISKDLLKNCKK